MTSAIPATGQNYPHLPLRVSEPEDRHGPHSSIMVFDAAHNDIAEFFHSDHATVGQTYDHALALANALVLAASPAPRAPAAVPEELRRLSEAATPGPWFARGDVSPWIADSPEAGRHKRIILCKDACHGGAADCAFIAAAVNYVRTLAAAPAAPPADGGTEERLSVDAIFLDRLAQHLHDEEDDESVGGRGNGWTWPEHENDTGYRGGGGRVTITPTDARLRHLEAATRIAHCVDSYQASAAPSRTPAGAAGDRVGYVTAEAAEKEANESYEIGKRDGYDEGVQDAAQRVGLDGEYRCSPAPERHCPDAATMLSQIAEYVESLEVTRPASPAPAASAGGEGARLADLIRTRLLGVHPDEQDLELEDADWRLILAALAPAAQVNPGREERPMARPDVGVMRELLARVKLARGPDRRIDYEIFTAFATPGGANPWDPASGHFYTASIDVAAALFEHAHAGWSRESGRSGFGNPAWCRAWNPMRSPGSSNDYRADHNGGSEPLAICACTLTALIAAEDQASAIPAQAAGGGDA